MDKLLNTLGEEGHHTPFEKSFLHFLVTAETASHIHLLKHRVGVSINGESARYKEHKEDKFYVPEDWPTSMQQDLTTYTLTGFRKYHEAIEVLVDRGFDRKRAKESARFFLPYSSQLVLDVSFNWRSFMHFQHLRNDEHAQDEIEWIAQEMLEQVRATGDFPMSLEAFGY
jgi:flavin-dependent thymidylate synthase